MRELALTGVKVFNSTDQKNIQGGAEAFSKINSKFSKAQEYLPRHLRREIEKTNIGNTLLRDPLGP